MNIKNLNRVFFHELGHFIAQELNYKIYNVAQGTEEIWIKPLILNKDIDYIAGTKVKKPKGYILKKDKRIIDFPIHFIGNVVYGCIIQTLYLKRNEKYKFEDCFGFPNKNGSDDVSNFASTNNYFNSKKRREVINFIKNNYIQELENQKRHMDKLFSLNVIDFLNDNYTIKLNELRIVLKDFMSEHEKNYSYFIEKIKKIKEHSIT